MPTKTSRNAPCPCGSGKKYKKCCLAKDEAAEASVAVSEGAVARAHGWLRDHYPDEFERAIALDYFDSLTPDQFEELDELPEDLLGMVHLNAFEWVLAEGEIGLTEDEDDIVPVMELVLGEGGPLMEANERRYLQLLATEPIDSLRSRRSGARRGAVARFDASPRAEAGLGSREVGFAIPPGGRHFRGGGCSRASQVFSAVRCMLSTALSIWNYAAAFWMDREGAEVYLIRTG